MASGGMVLIKYLLFFFNFIFWISGIALIVIGGIIKGKYGDFIQLSDSSITTGPIFLIIIGVIVAIVGFLGCCGAYKENYCMVTTFAVLLAIIFILEIAAGALAYAYRSKLEEYATDGIEKGIADYFNSSEYKKIMNKLQSEFECCGAKDSKGYEDYFNKAGNNETFPQSCCKDQDKPNKCPKTIGDVKKNASLLYQEGCVKGFQKYLKDHLVVVGGVGIGIAFIQLIGIVFACCLMRSIKKEYEVM